MKFLLFLAAAVAAAVGGSLWLRDSDAATKAEGPASAKERALVEPVNDDPPEGAIIATSDEWINELREEATFSLQKQGRKKKVEFRTYGPLGQQAASIVARELHGAIHSFVKKLENGKNLSAVKALTLEHLIIARRIQLGLLTNKKYFTMDPGKARGIWRGDTADQELIMTRINDPSKGKVVEVVYVLRYKEFPSLKDAKNRLFDARYTEAYQLEVNFNGFPLETRKKALANANKNDLLKRLRKAMPYKRDMKNFRVTAWTPEEVWKAAQ